MHLFDLLNGLKCEIIGNSDLYVDSLSCSTDTVRKNCMFFCLAGKNYDGHELAAKAVGDGACAVVCEHKCDVKCTQIVVEDCRRFMALVAKTFYQDAADAVKIIGIVGTNGKTSCTYILDSIFSAHGYKTAVIGTNGVCYDGKQYPTKLTTPDPIELHYLLHQMRQKQVEYVFLEVSAHAIYYKKLCGVKLDCAVFTNFSQDHLDFFETMENYGKVKKSFFTPLHVKNAVVNADDDLGREIAERYPSAVTYSVTKKADVYAENCREDGNRNSFDMVMNGERLTLSSKLCGRFNVYNCLCSAVTAKLFGVSDESIRRGIERITAIEGRNQTFFREDNVRLVVDFAHSPDGIRNILSFLKSVTENRLIVLFGCGGNRDRFKRAVMGSVASAYASLIVLTNDNPRYETPEAIAKDISVGITCPFVTILNRKEAILYAMSQASTGDCVAILGKGAETNQETMGVKTPYSDVDTVLSILHKRRRDLDK